MFLPLTPAWGGGQTTLQFSREYVFFRSNFVLLQFLVLRKENYHTFIDVRGQREIRTNPTIKFSKICHVLLTDIIQFQAHLSDVFCCLTYFTVGLPVIMLQIQILSLTTHT